MICRRATYFADSEMIEYFQQVCGWNSKSTHTKNYIRNYARYNTLKNNFLWFMLVNMIYENIKIKLWSRISTLKSLSVEIFNYKHQMIVKFTYVL